MHCIPLFLPIILPYRSKPLSVLPYPASPSNPYPQKFLDVKGPCCAQQTIHTFMLHTENIFPLSISHKYNTWTGNIFQHKLLGTFSRNPSSWRLYSPCRTICIPLCTKFFAQWLLNYLGCSWSIYSTSSYYFQTVPHTTPDSTSSNLIWSRLLITKVNKSISIYPLKTRFCLISVPKSRGTTHMGYFTNALRSIMLAVMSRYIGTRRTLLRTLLRFL